LSDYSFYNKDNRYDNSAYIAEATYKFQQNCQIYNTALSMGVSIFGDLISNKSSNSDKSEGKSVDALYKDLNKQLKILGAKNENDINDALKTAEETYNQTISDAQTAHDNAINAAQANVDAFTNEQDSYSTKITAYEEDLANLELAEPRDDNAIAEKISQINKAKDARAKAEAQAKKELEKTKTQEDNKLEKLKNSEAAKMQEKATAAEEATKIIDQIRATGTTSVNDVDLDNDSQTMSNVIKSINTLRNPKASDEDKIKAAETLKELENSENTTIKNAVTANKDLIGETLKKKTSNDTTQNTVQNSTNLYNIGWGLTKKALA
jgi:hypothetical protein